jgi:phosphoribosylglycinamide formyltransferase 1
MTSFVQARNLVDWLAQPEEVPANARAWFARLEYAKRALMTRKRVGILISGRGSNMMSLIAACREPDFPAEIAVVVSNRPEAPGLEHAAAAGIATVAIDHKLFGSRVPFEMKLHGALLDHGVDLVCNAGFMRLLTGGFVDRWRDRQLNIHPSLLPALPGLDTHARAIDQGLMIHGCTVHFVRLEMDTGPIVAQAAVPVLPTDTPETLGARVLAQEHILYPHALRLVAGAHLRIENEKALISTPFAPPQPLISPPLSTSL